jgi:hypothetical protein
MDLGRRKILDSISDIQGPSHHVESLNDARTKVADFCNSCYMAFRTLPLRKQRVQTRMRLG